jgi:adenylate cyclase
MAHLSAENTRAARRKFEKDEAEALAELAHVLMIDYLRGWNDATKENIRRAEKALKKAYTIHRSVPLAHVAESKIREVKGDLEGSIESLDAALALDPGLADAYAHKANAFILLGEAEKAPELLTKAIDLIRGQFPSELGLFHWFMGRAYFNMGAYFKSQGDDNKARDSLKESIDSLKTSVRERPTTWFSWAHLISAYALTDRLEKPDADVQEVVNTYRAKFQKDWPLDKIKAYYDQPKYHGEYPQLQAALKEYLSGLETAHNTVKVP